MNIIGIIAEYNPFHTGHAHQLREIAHLHPQALRLVVMSGDFVQRGEPAYFSKFLRAQWALSCGAHVVMELPSYFATSAAEIFAAGAVRLLAGLGVDGICFGSETTDLASLRTIASISHTPALQAHLHQLLREGYSYGQALRESLCAATTVDPSILDAPNALLGIEYLRAIETYQLTMKPLIIQRQSAYHDETLGSHPFPSATALRETLMNLETLNIAQLQEQFHPWIPEATLPSFMDTILQGNYLSMERYHDLLLYESRKQPLSSLEGLQDFTEGLHHKWKQSSQEPTWKDCLRSIKSKRYSFARLQRMGAASVLQRSTEQVALAHTEGPTYGRLLGFAPEGRYWLKHYTGSLPVINRLAPFYEASTSYTKMLLDGDILATNIRSLCLHTPQYRRGNLDFITSPIVHS